MHEFTGYSDWWVKEELIKEARRLSEEHWISQAGRGHVLQLIHIRFVRTAVGRYHRVSIGIMYRYVSMYRHGSLRRWTT